MRVLELAWWGGARSSMAKRSVLAVLAALCQGYDLSSEPLASFTASQLDYARCPIWKMKESELSQDSVALFPA